MPGHPVFPARSLLSHLRGFRECFPNIRAEQTSEVNIARFNQKYCSFQPKILLVSTKSIARFNQNFHLEIWLFCITSPLQMPCFPAPCDHSLVPFHKLTFHAARLGRFGCCCRRSRHGEPRPCRTCRNVRPTRVRNVFIFETGFNAFEPGILARDYLVDFSRMLGNI